MYNYFSHCDTNVSENFKGKSCAIIVLDVFVRYCTCTKEQIA